MKPQFDLAEGANLPHFTIEGTMPSLNEYLAEVGRNPRLGGKLKRDYVNTIIQYLRLSEFRHYQATKPVVIHYVFYEPNMKRDHDNVASCASKFIQDALRDIEVIADDGWKQVLNYTHDFYLDKDNPRIEVYIEEIEE